MSFVISRKQYLAPTETRVQYEPLIFEDEGFEVNKIDVGFGHPLYTTVADIFYVRSIADEIKILPMVPDGCMTMVFRSDDIGSGEISGYICGVTDELKKLEIMPGEGYIFIRFLPGAGSSFIEGDAGKLTNKSIPIEESLLGTDRIFSVLERENGITERIRLISRMIRSAMKDEPNKYLIRYCTERIFRNQGNIRVEKLAEETGFTARHIDKMFERCVGISPKLYSQIIRLQTSMNRIMEEKDKLLVDIALDCGFFDHAHMNRTYRKLIRCSSGEFRKNLFTKIDYDQIERYISI